MLHDWHVSESSLSVTLIVFLLIFMAASHDRQGFDRGKWSQTASFVVDFISRKFKKSFKTRRASPKPTSRRRPCIVTSIPKSSFSLIKAREALKTFPVPFSPSIRLHASRGKSLADYFLKAIKYQTKLFVKWQERKRKEFWNKNWNFESVGIKVE